MLSISATPGSCPAIARSRRQSACLGHPQVRRLAQERGAVDLPEAGEQVAEVAPEVGVEALVGVEAEELADDLDRQHLAVREDRCRAALAQPTFAAQVAEEVVHEAEHGDDEGLQVHGCGPRGCLATDQPLSCPGELRDLCRSRKPARRVSFPSAGRYTGLWWAGRG